MALTKISRAILDTGISDSSDATAITIDSSEQVGIGTSSPSKKLHVEIAGDASLFDRTGSAGGVMQFASGGTVKGNVGVQSGGFGVGGGFRDPDLFVATGGNVGIGTTSPAATLQVKTQTNGNAAFQNSTSVSGGVKINCFNDAANASSPFEIDGSTLQFNIAAVEKIRINSDGKLLIGATSSDTSDVLQIESPASGGGYGIQIRRNDNNTDQQLGQIKFGNTVDSDIGQLHVKTDGANNSGAMVFSTASSGTTAEKMRISSSGVVNVGTTEGTAKFNVGNGSGNAIIEMASSSATAVYYEHINRSNTSGSVDVGYYARNTGDHKFYTGSYTVRFTINENGGANGSDERLKKDIENISYGLDTVKSLQPRKFKWKETDNDGIGFIAQEVESLIPEVVADTTDAKGETEEVTKVLNYANLTAVLTKSIQELSTKLEAAEARITALEG